MIVAPFMLNAFNNFSNLNNITLNHLKNINNSIMIIGLDDGILDMYFCNQFQNVCFFFIKNFD